MNHRGAGDRWLAGQAVDGVAFALHDPVRVTGGRFAGKAGSISLLLAIEPEPVYLVRLEAALGDARVRQSDLALRP